MVTVNISQKNKYENDHLVKCKKKSTRTYIMYIFILVFKYYYNYIYCKVQNKRNNLIVICFYTI